MTDPIVTIQQGPSTWQGPQSAIPLHLLAAGGRKGAESATDTPESAEAVSGALCASAVKVKPLVWQERDEDTFWAAEGCGEMYYIRHYVGMKLPYRVDPSRLGGVGLPALEAAKAVAQADYEARILSALEGGAA